MPCLLVSVLVSFTSIRLCSLANQVGLEQEREHCRQLTDTSAKT